MTEAPRALVVTDSDSYVKWGAALAGQMPKDWSLRLVVVRGNALPSRRQVAEALAGTRFEPDDAAVVGCGDLAEILAGWAPDVVLAAARGLTVDTVLRMIPDGPSRPVVVSGLAGMSIPVLTPGLRMRRGADVFVVHSRRELREFADEGLPHRYELATIPFLATAPRTVATDAVRSRSDRAPVRDRIVFAAQAMVPASRADRVTMLRRLIETARAHPELRVVIKVRAREGEPQTHVEQWPYEDLMYDLVEAGEPIPPNLAVESGAMAWHLRRAVGLASISSTALLEAVAADVPCLAIDDFGVGREQINLVLVGSGLLASTDHLVRGEFRSPAPEWLDDNYFHPAEVNSWVPAVEELLDVRRATGLPPLDREPRTVVSAFRAAVYGRLAFVREGAEADAWHRAFLVVGFWEHRRRWAVMRWRRRVRGA